MLKFALEYARRNRQQHVEKLCDWLRIPSISTLPEHADDVRSAACWIRDYLEENGLQQARVQETGGHPVVTAQWMNANNAPTILLYGHFDVQPPDPLEEWNSPPFDPQQIGENLYARGASDDKGQAFALLASLESYLKSSGKLPVNVKILLEGEEEIQSRNLPGFLRAHSLELRADSILICDQDMFSPQHPVVMYGVRGNLFMEVQVKGPARDLHSGTFGGAVDNPFNVLARLLAALQDTRTRRISIPGFYDRIRVLSEEERRLINKAPVNDSIGLHLTGAPLLAGEEGFCLVERISLRPTLEIHGIVGGFTGQGSKTVIPSKATAKISMRLVPDQDPYQVSESLESYLRQLAPPTVHLEFKQVGLAKPVVIDYNTEPVRLAAEAYRLGFQAEPIYFRGGGSLPFLFDMIDSLSVPKEGPIPVAMIGFGLPDDCTHAPNEKLNLSNFFQGIETVIHYLFLMGNCANGSGKKHG